MLSSFPELDTSVYLVLPGSESIHIEGIVCVRVAGS